MQVGRSLPSAGRRRLHLLHGFRSLHLNGHDQDHELLLLRCLSHRDLRGARQLLDSAFSIRGDPDVDVVRWTSLLSRYARRGYVDEARVLFDVMPHRNLVTWNSMLSAYVASGRFDTARHLFEGMPERNVVSWTSMLCALLRAGRTCEAAELFGAMPDRNVVSWNAMVAGLARNGEIDAARRMFDGMPERDRASWNAMIAAYAERSMMGEARRLFDEMGGDADVVTWTTVISGYCRAGYVGEAYGLFLKMPPVTRNVVTWTAMIGGFSWNGYCEDAITLFLEMNQTARVAPNCETLISLLYACTGLGLLRLGKQVHSLVIVYGMNGPDLQGRLAKGLIQMYCRFHVLDWAQWIFGQCPVISHDIVVWNSMVNGFAKVGRLEEARSLFDRTPLPDQITTTTMIFAYLNAGEVLEGLRLFDRMGPKDDIAWTAVISGLVQNELVDEALGVFSEMRAAGVRPLDHTFAALLGAAGSTARLETGEQLHGLLARTRCEPDTAVGNALVSMYAKCGDVGAARRAFAAMAVRDVVSWNAIIMGLSHHGLADEALRLFEAMPMPPDAATFLGALAACSQAGMVDRGREIFASMAAEGSAAPGPEHYACMVHLLGRAGQVAEAERLVAGLPFGPGVAVWGALLGACGGREKGEAWAAAEERVAWRVIEMDPLNAAAHVGLCRLYATRGKSGEEGKVRREMRRKGVRKVAGMSWVVVSGETYVFVSGDRLHSDVCQG